MSAGQPPTPHPLEEQLLRLSDGELAAREAASTRNHLELCWLCRSRLDDLQAGIADYMRYERNVLAPLLPSPPGPWMDLGQRMDDLDAVTAIRSKTSAGWTPWLAAAALVLLGLFIFGRFDRVPSVSAAGLLRKAAAAESARPVSKRRLQIRTRHRSFTRSPVSAADPDLQRLFEQANFNWDNPLSAESYRAWHDRLPQKQDDVKSTPTGYVIHTSTTASVLTDATLTLRGPDLQADSERLEFQPGEWVEISQAGDEPATVPLTVPKARSQEPPPPAGPAEELQVTLALHRIGADLGEPIELRQDGSKLVVAAMGLSARRQSQVRAAVAKIPGVEVRFNQPELMGSQPGIPLPSRRNGSGTLSALQVQIQNQLGDPASVEEFTNRVLDASEAAMSRAYALRALARRFPPPIETQLTPNDRNILAGLRDDHLKALKPRIKDIIRLLEPAVSAQAATSAAPYPNWQTQMQELFTAVQRVDQLLISLLAGGDATVSEQSPGELSRALGLVEAELDRAQ